MTILDLLFCVGASLCIGFLVCWLYLVAPTLSLSSRLIGKLNQKEYDVTRWKAAYARANNDFMKLA